VLVAAALALITAATKVATGWWAARRIGVGPRGRWRAGTALVPRGEFSIVIAGLAVAREPELGPLATAYVLILAVLGPVLARTSEPLRITLGRPLTALAGRRSARPPAGEMRPREP
ncbi:MAG TPA: cation:proton antiporter, partial [Actinomycetota bacterium]|nr:cation:proton antiporter [Actinomycetota bacterium]